MAQQKDLKSRIGSVKNIQKITRAMEMVAAARLRRAEQRIAALRPYANAIRRMTRQAAQAAGGAESARVMQDFMVPPLLEPVFSRLEPPEGGSAKRLGRAILTERNRARYRGTEG